MDSIQGGRGNEDNCVVGDLNPHMSLILILLAVTISSLDIKTWREWWKKEQIGLGQRSNKHLEEVKMR